MPLFFLPVLVLLTAGAGATRRATNGEQMPPPTS